MAKEPQRWDVIVIGAGPAGIMAAGKAAHSRAKVLLVEKMRQAGRKLLITGKGRCNITHDADTSVYYQNIFPNGRFLKHAFHSFFKDDILKIMHDHGVETTTERGSRVFPVSNEAKDVLRALLDWMGKKNIEMVFNTRVNELIVEEGQVKGIVALSDKGRQELMAPNVIICTGGKSYPATGSTGEGYALAQQAGHTLTPPQPALVPLVTEGDIAGRLQGLGLKNVNAVVWVNGKKTREEFGELMFTHYGLTGPIILTLSRHVVEEQAKGHKTEIAIDLKPALDEQKLDARLLRDLNEHGKKQLENIFKLWLPSSLIPVFLELLQLDGKKLCNQLSGKDRRRILLLMKNFRFTVTGHPGYKEAIITAGGIPTSEIQSKTMESKLVKGLYFAGEVIDLDANTGGFNLQIAYSTGWLAGQSAAQNPG
ncbi:MAG: NAD(P)/FAD-dependent oxidoreductase [Bacteroidales bacterium]